MANEGPTLPPAPESFPALPVRAVGSAKQPALDAFSDFMALCRSIADDPKMAPHLKAAHLSALEATLTTQEGYVPLPKGVPPTIISTGFTLRRECDNRRIPVIYGRRVAQAYKQDSAKKHYRDWSELLAYLRFSAGSSAQFAQEVLVIEKNLLPALEALACAHALLARLLSVREDSVKLKRLYVPVKWLDSAGLDVEELALDGNESKWAKVRDQGIAHVRQLLAQAAPCVSGAPNAPLKRAFGWIVANIEAQCHALGKATFPVSAAPVPSKLGRLLAYWRILLARSRTTANRAG
jgi:phytoene/squalene synthetase